MVTSCGSLKFELPSRIQRDARPDIVTNRLPSAVAAGSEDEAGRIARGRCCPIAVGDAVIDELEADHMVPWSRGGKTPQPQGARRCHVNPHDSNSHGCPVMAAASPVSPS